MKIPDFHAARGYQTTHSARQKLQKHSVFVHSEPVTSLAGSIIFVAICLVSAPFVLPFHASAQEAVDASKAINSRKNRPKIQFPASLQKKAESATPRQGVSGTPDIGASPQFPNAAKGASDSAGDSSTAKGSDSSTAKGSDGTIINVKNADISALIRIFSEKTKRNFILDERVKGKVSLFLPKEVSAEESLKILDSVLALKGFTTVPISENLWKVIPSKEAIQSTIPTILDDHSPNDTSAAVITRLIHLNHISAEDAKQIVTPLVSGTGLVNAYTGTNSLIIIDSEDNISRVLDLIENLDVASRGREMTIIPIKHADAVEVSQKLQEILGEQAPPDASSSDPRTAAFDSIRARIRETTGVGSAAARTPISGSAGAGVGTLASSETTIAAQSLAPKIIPDERTNSIIVIADDETTAKIRALISQLDSEVNRSGFRFYVYRCLHANAEELADVLGGLSGEGGGLSRTSATEDTNNPLGLNRNSRNRGGQFSSTQGRLDSQNRTPGRSRSENSGGNPGSSSVSFGEDLSITSDPSTNSLIIYSGRADYEKILDLLAQLDVKPRQVLVEAMLLDVDVDESNRESTSFITTGGGADGGVFAQSSFGGNIASILADPTQLSNFTIAAASTGILTLPGPGDSNIEIPAQTVLLNAVRNNQRANVLSAPNILATDNQQAEIVVGENVPFIASTSTSGENLNNTFNTVDRQDVGITLRITPQISSNDTVRMEIFTEVSNVEESTATSTLGPTTTLKTSETTIIAKNGQMIVMGGLLSDEVNEVDTGVPYLMDVPVLGYLFRSTSLRTKRKNLLIFITPRIIEDQFDHRDVTRRKRDEAKASLDFTGSVPAREDVLYNSEIDNVMLAEPFSGTPPSTIRGPKG
ncbi:MAG: type II secretion system secretin GspD, partial [Bdellovibrionales bacterium]|nr:type II secretion system secretin GspD [Bdellovibrionales bacterium]